TVRAVTDSPGHRRRACETHSVSHGGSGWTVFPSGVPPVAWTAWSGASRRSAHRHANSNAFREPSLPSTPTTTAPVDDAVDWSARTTRTGHWAREATCGATARA